MILTLCNFMTKKIIFPTYRKEQQIKFQKMSLLATS